MYVGDQGEDRTIASFLEEGKAGHKPHHHGFRVRVHEADDEHEATHDEGQRVHQHLLRPQRAARHAVHEVAADAAQRPENRVQESEHGCPATRAGLAERREVLGVVRPEEGVDRQLRAEGAEVGYDERQCGEGDDCLDGAVIGGFLDQFPAGGVDEVFLVQACLLVLAPAAV